MSLEGTVEEAGSLLGGALLHEEREAGGSPRLEEVRSHIQRQQARHPLSSQTRLMQWVGEGSCGVHAKETHTAANCILHALCRLCRFLIGCLLSLYSHWVEHAGSRDG